jgi:hypothetical protein
MYVFTKTDHFQIELVFLESSGRFRSLFGICLRARRIFETWLVVALSRVSRVSSSIAAFSLELAVHIVPLGNLSMNLLEGQLRRKIIISCPEVSSFDLLAPHTR